MFRMEVPYDKRIMQISLEDKNLAGILVGRQSDYVCDKSEKEIVEESLNHVIGSQTLEELAKGKKDIVIISSDHTRPVPSKIITPILLRRIRSVSPDARIRILVSTGFHRPSTKEELIVLYFFAGKWILYAFIDEPTALTLQTGIEFLRILSPLYFVISMKFVADGILRGSGMMEKFMVTTFLDLILRVGIAVLLSRTILGATGIWCAWPIGWIVAVILSLAFYKSGRWNDLEKVESGKKIE